jgi:hypothetical protein
MHVDRSNRNKHDTKNMAEIIAVSYIPLMTDFIKEKY